MRTSKWVLGSGLMIALAATVGAQGTFVRSVPRGTFNVGEGSALSPANNALIGTARDEVDDLIPEARVQLRNLRSGSVDQTAVTNAEGAFAFRAIEPGTYVVEMVIAGGAVAAISEATTIGSAEVVQTLVRLTARTRTFGWWLGSTANSAVAQAASSGVLAVDPGEPVSPQ